MLPYAVVTRTPAPLTVKHIASMIARSEVGFALARDMTCGKEVLIESNIERQAIGDPTFSFIDEAKPDRYHSLFTPSRTQLSGQRGSY